MKRSNIAISVLINIVITVFEITAGILTGSMALISDALHNFSDVGAMSLSWWGEKVAKKAPNDRKTYGYNRVEILIAFINALTLAVVMIYVFYESVTRLFEPVTVSGSIMFFVALTALIGNGISTYLLEKDSHKNLNLKSAWLHSLQDALFSLGVLAGSVIIYFFNWNIVDPLISIFLCLFLLREIYKLLRQSIDILMESMPVNIDFNIVKAEIKKISGVKEVNDLHIWQTGSNNIFLSVHVLIDNLKDEKRNLLLCEIKNMIKEKFNIEHTTIQMVHETQQKLNDICTHCN